jgi:hypothetical protein
MVSRVHRFVAKMAGQRLAANDLLFQHYRESLSNVPWFRMTFDEVNKPARRLLITAR